MNGVVFIFILILSGVILYKRINNQAQNQTQRNQSFGGQFLEEDYLNDNKINERYPHFILRATKNVKKRPNRATNYQIDYVINNDDKKKALYAQFV